MKNSNTICLVIVTQTVMIDFVFARPFFIKNILYRTSVAGSTNIGLDRQPKFTGFVNGEVLENEIAIQTAANISLWFPEINISCSALVAYRVGGGLTTLTLFGYYR